MHKLSEYLGNNNCDTEKACTIALRLEIPKRDPSSSSVTGYGTMVEMENSETIVHRCIGLSGPGKGLDFYCG